MQFLPCLRGREAPHNRGLGRIADVFIGGDLTDEHGFVRDAAIQTLALQDTQLDFGHIQPTAMLGRVMKFELLQNATGVCGFKGLIERRGFVRVEIVQHDPNHVRRSGTRVSAISCLLASSKLTFGRLGSYGSS